MTEKCLRPPGCVNHSACETPMAGPQGGTRPLLAPGRARLTMGRHTAVRSRFDVLRIGTAGLSLVLWLACSGVPALPDLDEGGAEFSDGLAAAHLDALSSLSPRWPGSREDRRARKYLARAFEAVGAVLVRGDGGGDGPLIAEVRGRSEDVVLLLACYGVLGSSEWVDDSGLALLIELARLYAAEPPPPYTIRFALAEVRPPVVAAGEGAEGAWRPVKDAAEARRRVVASGRELAAALAPSLVAAAPRFVVAFEPRAEAGGRIARDLRSHPIIRNVFWETAARLNYANTFSKESGWSSPAGLHGAFSPLARGRVLALVDERLARPELSERTLPTGSSPAVSLAPIGRVTLASVARLMRRFEKIDAFRSDPEGIGRRDAAHPKLNKTSDESPHLSNFQGVFVALRGVGS